MSVVLVIFYYFCSLDYDPSFIKKNKKTHGKEEIR